jgi:hypothetical protein
MTGPASQAAQGAPAGFQGAWVLEGRDCEDVYASAGKASAFKKPVDIFAPAFIISGNRLKTPMASCRIKAAQPTGDRQILVLDCANAVASNEVRAFMAPQPSGSLRRDYSAQDPTGVGYRRCS